MNLTTNLDAKPVPLRPYDTDRTAPHSGDVVAVQNPSLQSAALSYKNMPAKELGARLNLPPTWITENAAHGNSDDPIPCFPLGKHRRFRWCSPELAAWIDRHVVCPRELRKFLVPGQAEYNYLDSAQFAEVLNVPESWVRDLVRARSLDPVPHVRFGKYVRFRIGSPELEAWLNRRILSGNNRAVVRAHRKETIQ